MAIAAINTDDINTRVIIVIKMRDLRDSFLNKSHGVYISKIAIISPKRVCTGGWFKPQDSYRVCVCTIECPASIELPKEQCLRHRKSS